MDQPPAPLVRPVGEHLEPGETLPRFGRPDREFDGLVSVVDGGIGVGGSGIGVRRRVVSVAGVGSVRDRMVTFVGAPPESRR
ncbi:hypothetical protein [Halorussus sp. MSC15.2]|uniref:hypothetical protein n=1 Tax=Halorussus sp. MSC15.2 TaxID=2283638 RepID=UPI00196724A6|nr:hypothetical protein [Halorussus sp. MSC15.2]